ncbi:MAG: cyclic nucleotide-binding domain-containing protein [Marinomonadaceae bacterium]
MNTVQINEVHFDISLPTLKTGSVFGALSEESIDYLLQRGVIYSAIKEESIFQYDDKGDSFYTVLHGSLDYLKHHDNQFVHTRFIEFGESIGFVSMIALHDRVGNVYAKEDSLLLEISSQLFSDFHDHYPFDFGILLMNLSRDMARTIREISNTLVTKETTKHQ